MTVHTPPPTGSRRSVSVIQSRSVSSKTTSSTASALPDHTRSVPPSGPNVTPRSSRSELSSAGAGAIAARDSGLDHALYSSKAVSRGRLRAGRGMSDDASISTTPRRRRCGPRRATRGSIATERRRQRLVDPRRRSGAPAASSKMRGSAWPRRSTAIPSRSSSPRAAPSRSTSGSPGSTVRAASRRGATRSCSRRRSITRRSTRSRGCTRTRSPSIEWVAGRPRRPGRPRRVAQRGRQRRCRCRDRCSRPTTRSARCSRVVEAAAACAAAGVPLHLDAVGAFGHVPLSFRGCARSRGSRGGGLVALSVASHKLGGPVGVGALVVAREAKIEPLAARRRTAARPPRRARRMPPVRRRSPSPPSSRSAELDGRGGTASARCATGSERASAPRSPRRELSATRAERLPGHVHLRPPRRAGRLAAAPARQRRDRGVDRLGVPGRACPSRRTSCSRWVWADADGPQRAATHARTHHDRRRRGRGARGAARTRTSARAAPAVVARRGDAGRSQAGWRHPS